MTYQMPSIGERSYTSVTDGAESGVGTSPALGRQAAAPEPQFVFSVGGLLAWVQLQLAEFDGQVGDLMRGIKQRKEQAASDTSFAAHLRAAKGLSGKKLDEWCAARRAESSTPQQAAVLDRVAGGGFSKEALEAEAQRFDASAGGATSSTDVDMIRLQALISSRAQALTFASNGMAGLNETSKAIIGNVRA